MTKILIAVAALILFVSPAMAWTEVGVGTFVAKQGQYTSRDAVEVEETNTAQIKTIHTLDQIDKNLAHINQEISYLQAAKIKLEALRAKVLAEAEKVELYVPPKEEK
jgi:hypothetical protein